jgi:hypothetical protein
VVLAARIGKEIRQRLPRDSAVPDEVQARAWHPHAKQHLALRKAEHDMAADRFEGTARQVALCNQAAPRDVIGEARLHVGQELPAHRRERAVGGDEEVGLFP